MSLTECLPSSIYWSKLAFQEFLGMDYILLLHSWLRLISTDSMMHILFKYRITTTKNLWPSTYQIYEVEILCYFIVVLPSLFKGSTSVLFICASLCGRNRMMIKKKRRRKREGSTSSILIILATRVGSRLYLKRKEMWNSREQKLRVTNKN